jgi:hypothetical protein
MVNLPALINLFSQDPDIRLLAGGLFLVLLGYLFYRYTGGVRNSLFTAAAVVFGVLFAVSPAVHLLSFGFLALAYSYLELNRIRNRIPYQPARAMVESGGIKRGLTPPEAAVLLEKPLNIVIGVVLAGLIRKGLVVQESGDPLVLVVAEAFQVQADDPHIRTALRREAAQAHAVIIHRYEEPFLTLLENKKTKPIQTLNLVAPVRALLRHTARRVQGYNLPETREYYQKHLGRARHDVAHANENGHGDRIKAQNFEWVLLDARVSEVYGETQPDWLAGPWTSGLTLAGWVARLMAAGVSSVPPEGLQVRGPGGQRLAIGGGDPVTAKFFEAVARNLG